MEMIKTEVLVIGGGLAGLSAALEAKKAGRDVLLVCKRKVGRSGNTLVAGAYISTVFPSAGDSPEQFARDTLSQGGWIGDPDLVQVMAEQAEDAIDSLQESGVRFLSENGHPQCWSIPGHSRPRTASCERYGIPAQVTGQALSLPLLKEADRAGISMLQDAMVLQLLRSGDRVVGALALTQEGEPVTIQAGAVVLACGAGAKMYPSSNNTREMTGDGLALACEAGAELRDLEFIQFHPAMGISPVKTVMPTTVFGEGALLRNREGYAFLKDYVPGGEPSTGRDEMSRAIYAELMAGRGVEGGVYLDLTAVPDETVQRCYSDLWALYRRRGCDLRRQHIVVGLSAHFLMGGMVIDSEGRSTVPGLWGAGEVTGGIHGANRLGGNALLEAVVFGRIAGRSAASAIEEAPSLGTCDVTTPGGGSASEVQDVKRALGTVLWEGAGVVRDAKGLTRGLERLGSLLERFGMCGPGEAPHLWWETRNQLTISRLLLAAALRREESRGAHFRSDYPLADDAKWCGSLFASLPEPSGEPVFRFAPQSPPKLEGGNG